ncbi:MAG: cupin domain-containing protein [Planctomycetota bacterium]
MRSAALAVLVSSAPLCAQSPSWLPLFERPTLSTGRYRIPARAADGQAPHDRDEVYHVLAGKGRFTDGDTTREVAAGDDLFVKAGATHRFHDVTEDLDLLVFFSAAMPGTGGMKEGPAPTGQTPYPETSARGMARIFYWDGPGSAGQVVLDFGRPQWKPEYGAFLTKASGKRWRFGENAWTALDTNIPIELGGVRVPPGQRYAVLQNTEARGLELVLLDPDAVRLHHLDAYDAARTTSGIAVPLRHADAAFPAERLAICWTVDRAARDRGTLHVHFGPHELTADLVMHPDAAPSPAPGSPPAAAAADVASPEAIVQALYAVISGPAGAARDWERMRSLFHRTAKLVAIVKAGDGAPRALVMSPDDYIARSGPLLERDGFFEQEIHRRVDRLGDFANVWSTYEGRRQADDAEPFLRGINSIQLVHEQGRWFVLQVLWEQEHDAGPIPAQYLPAK